MAASRERTRAAAYRQREYYAKTAKAYDSAHVCPGDEHFIALEYIVGLLRVVRARSVLDVGAGTGRGVRFLRGEGFDARGVEPVVELREMAEAAGTRLIAGSAERLPYADGSFDAVVATALMHHVPNPKVAVAEMQRVARSAVMISDSNRFGQGTSRARLAKLVLHRAGVWPAFEMIRTRNRGYLWSEGDGIFYSYSIYDSLPQLAAWADRIFVIPTASAQYRWSPVTASGHGLLVALREPRHNWAGVENEDGKFVSPGH